MASATDLERVGLTRHKLLLATETLVIREGVHALTVRRIAAAAGVNSALIRYHFGSTDALLRELALRNAACLRDARESLLLAVEAMDEPQFEAAVDALVLPLWTGAAMSPDHRAIVVLDEIYSRAKPALHPEILATFIDGVRRVTAALKGALGDVDDTALAWRIRFVTAAALDIPPRAPRREEAARHGAYGDEGLAERLDQFRRFARQALRTI